MMIMTMMIMKMKMMKMKMMMIMMMRGEPGTKEFAVNGQGHENHQLKQQTLMTF